MVRTLTLISLIVLLTSCTANNLTNDVRYSNFIDKCYMFNVDSFLYSLNYCKSESETCYGVQAYRASKHLPANEKEVLRDLNHWNYNIDYWARVGGEKESEFSGTLRAGVKARINNIFFGDQGTLGKYWFVELEINSGEHKGKLVELASPYHLMAPFWVGYSRPPENPKFVSKYILQCTET